MHKGVWIKPGPEDDANEEIQRVFGQRQHIRNRYVDHQDHHKLLFRKTSLGCPDSSLLFCLRKEQPNNCLVIVDYVVQKSYPTEENKKAGRNKSTYV